MAVQARMFPEIEGPEFARSEAVAEVAAAVLREHGRMGGVPRLFATAEAIRDGEVHVLYLLNGKPFDPDKDDEDEPHVAGMAIKAPRLWRDVTGFDAVIWCREYFWERFDQAGREALLLHELLHVEVERGKDNEPKVRIRKHDVEDFVDVGRRYGPTAGRGAEFVRAVKLFERGEPVTEPGSGITSITVTGGGRSVTIDREAARRIRRSLGDDAGEAAASEAPTVDDDDVRCDGSNHVPGCEHFLAEAFGGELDAMLVGDQASALEPAVGDQVVALDGSTLSIKSIDGETVYLRPGRLFVARERLAWDEEAGGWRVRPQAEAE